MVKLIILDRDGVINFDSETYIKTLDEWQPIPGSLQAIAALNQAGFYVAIATNQSGIGRGLFDEQTLIAIHDKMRMLLDGVGGHIDFIAYCPHHPNQDCACRKPKAGLLLQIAAHFQCSLQDVPFIGDSERDIVAAHSVGARPMLVKTGKGENTLQTKSSLCSTIPVFTDLADCVHFLLQTI